MRGRAVAVNDEVEPSANETPIDDELTDADMDQVVGGFFPHPHHMRVGEAV